MIFSFRALCGLGVLLGLAACAEVPVSTLPKITLHPVSFGDLDGWSDDNGQDALTAWAKSCRVMAKKNATQKRPLAEAGTWGDWQKICQELAVVPVNSKESARRFFETHFTPYKVENEEVGLFTGYYEAQLHGCLKEEGSCQTPLWQKPKDMITASLGDFKKEWTGKKLVGKVKENTFIPYDPRAEVAAGSLAGRAEPLAWVDDPVGAFFLEVQGSGQIQLKDRTILRVGYDAQNGHEYVPVGRVLAARGQIDKPVTMEKIRTWLVAHPEQAQSVMNENPSVVFFRRIDGEGPLGAQGVALTPMRSMAVDPAFVPLGTPLWVQTEKHQRLVIAQDTGGAIKGPVRGDLFWGAGVAAEKGAGEMQENGTYFLLLPKRGENP